MNVYTAIHLSDYEVLWSAASRTEEDLVAKIREYAVQEWRAEPADYPEIEDEHQAAEKYGDVLDKTGVLVTETFDLTDTIPC